MIPVKMHTTIVYPVERSVARAGDVLTFVLPKDVYDMATLRFLGLASIDAVGTLPRDVETMVQDVEVWMGDVYVCPADP